jgi:putative FmdB family regulatory protein
MPVYEYRCDQGHTFEVMQRMTDEPVASCTACSSPVQRVFHPVAVHFKGKGFYNTDYGTRRRQRELAQSAEGGSKDSSSSSSEGSTGSSGSDTSGSSSGGKDSQSTGKKADGSSGSSSKKTSSAD